MKQIIHFIQNVTVASIAAAATFGAIWYHDISAQHCVSVESLESSKYVIDAMLFGQPYEPGAYVGVIKQGKFWTMYEVRGAGMACEVGSGQGTSLASVARLREQLSLQSN